MTEKGDRQTLYMCCMLSGCRPPYPLRVVIQLFCGDLSLDNAIDVYCDQGLLVYLAYALCVSIHVQCSKRADLIVNDLAVEIVKSARSLSPRVAWSLSRGITSTFPRDPPETPENVLQHFR